jgi:hypothetical protein
MATGMHDRDDDHLSLQLSIVKRVRKPTHDGTPSPVTVLRPRARCSPKLFQQMINRLKESGCRSRIPVEIPACRCPNFKPRPE